jgi:hypothetical protein
MNCSRGTAKRSHVRPLLFMLQRNQAFYRNVLRITILRSEHCALYALMVIGAVGEKMFVVFNSRVWFIFGTYCQLLHPAKVWLCCHSRLQMIQNGYNRNEFRLSAQNYFEWVPL